MMMMSGRAGGGGATAGRYPFTASQWQELEHQALIYKCLASGRPIPSHLMPPLRRILDSALATSPSLAFPPQPSLGWGCFGMGGFGRKPDEDPEPGRCRRTDGKKWRCSKEAYPDSKYCEKHMHRGKNRSRKPVEMSLATPAPASAAASSATSAAAAAAATTSSPAPSYHHRPAPAAHDAASPYHHALYGGGGGSPYSAASARAYHHHAQQVSPFHLHLETTHPHPPPSYYSVDQRDYAYGHAAAKEVVGEHAFFSDGAGDRDRQQQAAAGQWQFKHLGMETKPPGPTSLFPVAGYGGGGAASPYGVDLGANKEDDEEESRRHHQQQHCFVLGADLRLERPSSGHDAAAAPAAQKPLRPFFDEWPHEKGNKGVSWMGFDGETQLSMSIPMAANDLPVTSRYRNGAHYE